MSDLITAIPDVTDGMSESFARLYGEPLFQLPSDLYIPPDALEIFLEAFEGPLDIALFDPQTELQRSRYSNGRGNQAIPWLY